MIDDFIFSKIIEILELEENNIVKNYSKVEKISLNVIKYVKDNKIELPVHVYRFLDDFDIRRNDSLYCNEQTKDIKNLLLI